MSLDRASSPSPEYRGIKRIQQACLNCRRKKAKCSGEKPTCGYCKRLGQDCEYWDRAKGSSNGGPNQKDSATCENPETRNEELSNRVGAIESKLDQLLTTLNAYMPTFANQRDACSPRTAPIPPSQEYSHPQNTSHTSSPVSGSNKSTFCVLPPPEVLASLVDAYFSRCHNQPYTFFQEQNFRMRLLERRIPEYLLFAVLASGLRFCKHPYFQGEIHKAASSYARESWNRIVSTWFATESDPNLHICQAITMLSILDFTAGRKHPAWLKIGLSIRIAQDLRLMMEPDLSLDFADQEERRRVFWSIYLLDKLCSCGRGRPASIIDAHCHVQLPCGELNFRNGEWENTQTLIEALTPGKHSELGDSALVVLAACILGQCAQLSIHGHGREPSQLPPWDSKSEFAAIYSKLLQLETEFDMGSRINNKIHKCVKDGVLDMQMAGPLVFCHALFHMSQCLLHHPFLLFNQPRAIGAKAPASFVNRALQTCRDNANSISAIIQDTKDAGYPFYFSFMGYIASVAVTINMLFLQDEDVSICDNALVSYQSSIDYLGELAKYWKCGARMATALHRLETYVIAYHNIAITHFNTEGVDEVVLETIWASLDYNSICETVESKGYAMPILGTQSPKWDIDFIQDGAHFASHNDFQQLNFSTAVRPQPTDLASFSTTAFEDVAAVNLFYG